MDIPVEFLSKLDVPNLLAMAAMLWVMNKRLDKKFEKIDQRFEKVDQRFEKIENRLSLIENDIIEIKTVLRLKECCMIKDSSQMKKAE